MKFIQRLRSRAGIAAVTMVAVASSAGAATMHRFDVSNTAGSGSGGATTFLQTTSSGGALQGEVASTPNAGIKIPFGILGEHNPSTQTFGIGVAGVSVYGYGVGAESLSATQPSMIALNNSGGNAAEAYGEGASTPTSFGFSQGATGLLAQSTNGNAIQVSTTTDNASAIYAEDDSQDGSTAVNGISFSELGFGVFGYGSSGIGAESETPQAGFPALYAFTATPGTELMDGVVQVNSDPYEVYAFNTPSQNASGTVDPGGTGTSSDFQINGDIYLSGHVYSGCGADVPQETDPADDCSSDAATTAKSRNGTTYGTYAAQHASSTIEDEGETRLVNGYAHVSLDPAFASTISTAEPYLVFTTPMGESRGLYVANRTASGFDVRENAAGRSNMAIDYRIVAHPYGVRVARMAPVARSRSFAKHKLSALAIARGRAIMRGRKVTAKTPHLKAHVMPRSFLSYAPVRR